MANITKSTRYEKYMSKPLTTLERPTQRTPVATVLQMLVAGCRLRERWEQLAVADHDGAPGLIDRCLHALLA